MVRERGISSNCVSLAKKGGRFKLLPLTLKVRVREGGGGRSGAPSLRVNSCKLNVQIVNESKDSYKEFFNSVSKVMSSIRMWKLLLSRRFDY